MVNQTEVVAIFGRRLSNFEILKKLNGVTMSVESGFINQE